VSERQRALRRRWKASDVVVVPTTVLSARLSPTALRLWIGLAVFANDDRQCWPSRRTLAKSMPEGTAPGTIRRARAELEDVGLLTVEYRHDPSGRETTPLYTLYTPVLEEHETAREEEHETTRPVPRETARPLNLIIEPDSKEVVVDEVRLVFDTWVAATGRQAGRTKLDEKRRRRIRTALDAYPTEDIVDAVVGWKHDPFYCGENDRGKTYNDIELLLRDAEHIERFRDMARDGAARTGPRPKAWSMLEQLEAEMKP